MVAPLVTRSSPCLHLGEQGNVAGEDTDLTLDRRDDDGVDGVGVHLGFGRDDFEGEGHLERCIR